MSNNDEQLIALMKEVAAGAGDKSELCRMLQKEVYGLVLPVLKDNKLTRATTKKILIELCQRMDEINLKKNIHRQVASITSLYLYELEKGNGEAIPTTGAMLDYEYNGIKEDEELYEQMRILAKALRNPDRYEEMSEEFQDLEPMSVILLEMYGYEMYSVDQIEDMLDIDSSFICNALTRTRAALLGIEIVEPEDEDLFAEDAEDEDALAEDEDVDILDFEDEDSADDLDEDSDEDLDGDSEVDGADVEDDLPAGVIAMFFPQLDKKRRLMIDGCILAGVVVIVALVFLISALGKSSGNSDKEQASTTQQTTTAATTATKAATTTKAADTTEASQDNNSDNNSDNSDNNSSDDNSSYTQAEQSGEGAVDTGDSEESGEESGNSGDNNSDTTPSEADTTTEAVTTTAAEQETTTTAPAETTTAAETTTTTAADAAGGSGNEIGNGAAANGAAGDGGAAN